MGWDYYYKPYVSVASRRAAAQREMKKLAKAGRPPEPVVIEGRKIATTFWGKAWCTNVESYSDYSNRLPRGRSYVCNGSVVDLRIEPGKITAQVMGSELYRIKMTIKPLHAATWCALKGECAGQIGSLVELLQGKLSKSVMELVTRTDKGLFPKPREIEMDCSCPDGAGLCKHLAATLYGVGARLDQRPDLLFYLRQVDHTELIAAAGTNAVAGVGSAEGRQTIAADALADVFGIELTNDVGSESRSPLTVSQKPISSQTVSMVTVAPPARRKRKVNPLNDAAKESAATASPSRPKKTASMVGKRLKGSAVQTESQPARKPVAKRANSKGSARRPSATRARRS